MNAIDIEDNKVYDEDKVLTVSILQQIQEQAEGNHYKLYCKTELLMNEHFLTQNQTSYFNLWESEDGKKERKKEEQLSMMLYIQQF